MCLEGTHFDAKNTLALGGQRSEDIFLEPP